MGEGYISFPILTYDNWSAEQRAVVEAFLDLGTEVKRFVLPDSATFSKRVFWCNHPEFTELTVREYILLWGTAVVGTNSNKIVIRSLNIYDENGITAVKVYNYNLPEDEPPWTR